MKSVVILLALFLSAPVIAVAQSGEALYRLFAEQTAAVDCFEVNVDLTHGEAAEIMLDTLRYPLRGKEVAEGWSWPDGHSRDFDYYRYKYLPLASNNEDRNLYEAEDKIGERQTMTERWRFDYFLAFANYASFVAPDDDQAALVLPLPPESNQTQLALLAEACLTPPATRESTTFWKATHTAPFDLTLKKRYLIGKLSALHLIDSSNGRRLATLQPRSPPPIANKELDHE